MLLHNAASREFNAGDQGSMM